MRARAGICQARVAISDEYVARWIQKVSPMPPNTRIICARARFLTLRCWGLGCWVESQGGEAITDAPKKMKLTPLAKAMNKPTKAMAVATQYA
jgi:hypothetical protein